MKKSSFLYLFVLATLLIACGNKQNQSSEKSEGTIHLQRLDFSYKEDSTNSVQRAYRQLTQADYDSLKISTVDELKYYSTEEMSIGSPLYSNDNGKLIPLHVETSGERADYLLSYALNGNLVGNVLLAYEDMVEYYSETSSYIEGDSVVAQTTNYSYEMENGKEVEKSETLKDVYQITPDFKIVKK